MVYWMVFLGCYFVTSLLSSSLYTKTLKKPLKLFVKKPNVFLPEIT